MLLFQYSFAQKYTYTFFTAADGLPTSEILSIAKDKKGQLWAGTSHGLSKYDGYTFTNYLYAESGATIGTVNMLKADGDKIWVGATTGLYCLLNSRVIKISSETSSRQSVHDILPEYNNHLWLATSNGPAKIPLNKIDYTGNKKINLEESILPEWKKSSLAKESDDIILLKNAGDGSIYFSSYYTLYRFLQGEKDPFQTVIKTSDKILSLFPVSKSIIFYDGALSEMNKVENGTYTNIYGKSPYNPGLKAGTDSTWYVGTSGIFCFHPQLEQASVFINTMEDAEVLWPSAMIKEGDGFWMASHQGLIKIKPALFEQYDLKTFQEVQEVYSFYQLNNGTLLTGANRGKIYKKQSDRFTNFFPVNKTAVSLAEIKCMSEDEDGRLWVGTGYQGIAVYSSGNLSNYTMAEGLHDNTITNFLKTKSGKFYAIGSKGLSEIKIDPKKNISFIKHPYPAKLSQQAYFYNGVESPDGTIWTAGEEGLFFLKNDSLQEYYLQNKKVQAADIRMDSNNNVWIAANGEGILHCRFDDKNSLRLIRKYSKQDGLSTDVYLRLLIDKNNNVWAGSAKGVSCIITNEKQKGRILNFDQNDGFIKSGYYYLNLYEDKSGKIWVGTTNGITSFDREKLLSGKSPPVIFITGINFPKKRNYSLILTH